MVKSGLYAKYRGKEFKANYSPEENLYLLFSEQAEDKALGFVPPRNGGRWRLELPPIQLDEIYRIITMGLYQGNVVQVMNHLDTGLYQLYAGMDLTHLGFTRIDKFEYFKVVNPDELERIWEERRNIEIC